MRKQFTPGAEDMLNYGSVPMTPLIFQDDVIHCVGGLNEARLASAKTNNVVNSLNLRLHEDKTSCIVMGSVNQRLQITRCLQSDPLMCGDIETKLKKEFKWLGQILSSGGLAESVAATVKDREGKVCGACLEIAQVVNDWRTRCVGGMETALLLWECCCIPSLLHGAGTLVEISPATIKNLNQLQWWFLRLVLQVGPGAPLASLTWDNCVLEMGLRVQMEKIMMIISIRDLNEDTLARKTYEEQKKNDWPGLAKETTKFCQDLGIEDCNTTILNRTKYKNMVLEACHAKNEQFLRSQAKGKCERIRDETYGRKDYISQQNILNTRNHYRTRYAMQPFTGITLKTEGLPGPHGSVSARSHERRKVTSYLDSAVYMETSHMSTVILLRTIVWYSFLMRCWQGGTRYRRRGKPLVVWETPSLELILLIKVG